jgi:hypothetical protein
MKEVVLDMDMKRMVGEFIDCAETIARAQLMLASGEKDDVDFATHAVSRSHEATKSVVLAAFEDEDGTGIIELAHIACSIAANVSAMLFEAEAAVSMEEE